ncbi:sulfatase family protein [Humisphaera borealis]|uniref:Arylsulfatase n=1 Tax=Humisphaera borealis TaxID=2807512 RepID=A0A7M2WRK7_9BACT|nr:arylsulfatase [Humisphaera borealis]QOV88148.1 arylsulfatase [Humisphaera borealis]
MKKLSRLVATLVFALLLVCVGRVHAGVEKPNIIVIMADDLGYGDISANGATEIQTPNVDKLAAEGLRFTSGYCSASTCTPTRFSLLTGTYAFRHKGTGIAPPAAPAIIQPGTETIPSLLKKAGYKTAVVGKWHLGLGGPDGPQWNGQIKPGPLDIGFDYCFLLPTTNDRVPSVYVENDRVRNLDPADPLWVGSKSPSPGHPTGITERDKLKLDWSNGHNQSINNGIGRIGFFTGGEKARWRDEDLADEWVKQSVQWIEKNKDGPFFLYFAAHDIHVPRMPNERFQGKSKLGLRGDSILQFDWCVGELTKTLDRLKLSDNTLIVLCSDNGPVLDDGYKDGAVEKLGKHTPAGPYTGGKYSVFEGGTRTPFITHWPGRIKPGVSDEMVCTIDLAASFAAMTGVPLAEGACLDSFNVSGALLGEKDARGRTDLIQQDNGTKFGLRAGNWKLQRGGGGRKAQGAAKDALFDLSKDAAEQNNVAAQFPDIVKEMGGKLDAAIAAGRTRPAK